MGNVNPMLGYLYNASGNASKDRKKRKKEDDDYKKRYAKAAKEPVMSNDALKVHYDSKKFEGKRGTIGGDSSYKWDNDLLKDLPIKRYGRSYSDKFNKLAEENGIPKGDRAGFMKYLDAQEEGVGNEVQSIKESVDKRTKAKMKSNRERRIEEKKQEEAKKNQRKTDKKPKETIKQNETFGEDVKDLASSFGKFVKGLATGDLDAATKDMAKTNEKLSKKSKEVQRGSRRAANAATLGASGALDKKQGADDYTNKRKVGEGGGTDIISDLVGSLAPGVAAVKGVQKIKGADKALKTMRAAGGKKRVAADVLEGAAAGAVTSAGQSGVKAISDRENFNAKDELKNAAINIGAGAVLDSVISSVGPQAAKALKSLGDKSGAKLNGMQKSQVANLTKYLQENEGSIKKTELQKIIDDSHNQLPAPKNVTKKEEIRDASEAFQTTKTPDTNTTTQLEKPEKPDFSKASDREVLDWVKKNPSHVDDDMRNELVNRYQRVSQEVDSLDDRNSDMYKEMEAALQKDGNMSDISGYNDKFQNKVTQSGRLEAHTKAEEDWKTAKEVQAMYKEKPAWARFSIPDGMDDDFKDQIPKRFLAYKSQRNVGLDLYQAADDAGFEDVDEFIDYLQFVDKNLRVKRKDLPIMKAGDVRGVMEDLDSTDKFLHDAVKNYAGYDDRVADMKDMLKSMAIEPEKPTGDYTPMKAIEGESTSPTQKLFISPKDSWHVPMRVIRDAEALPNISTKDGMTGAGYTIDVPNMQGVEGADPLPISEASDEMLAQIGLARDTEGKYRNLETGRKVNLESGKEMTEDNIDIEPEPLQPTMGQRNPVHSVDPDGSPNSFTAPDKDGVAEDIKPTSNRELIEQEKVAATTIDKDSFVDPDIQLEAKKTEAISFLSLSEKKLAPDLTKYAKGDKTVGKFLTPFSKAYQNYVDSNNLLDILEKGIVNKAIKSLEDGEITPTNAAKLSDLEYYKDLIGRGTGYAKMALVNEGAASQKAVSQISGYAKSLQNIVDKYKGQVSIQDLVDNRMVKRIMWLRENKGESWRLPHYDALIEKTLSKQSPAFEESDALFNAIQKEMLDQHQQYGLLNDLDIEALSEEPFYIPLERDKSWLRNSNMATQEQAAQESPLDAILGRTPSVETLPNVNGTRRVTPEVMEMENGNEQDYFRKPMEVLVERLHGMHRSGLRNDTHKQIKNLVQLSEDFSDTPIGQVLSVDEFNKVKGTAREKATGGFLEVIENGERSYLAMPQEFMTMIQKNDMAEPINKLQMLTSVVSGLKVRSLEYQVTSALRDLPQAFLNSQTANPIKYGKLAIQSLFEGRKQADAQGITFQRAYNPQDAGNIGSSLKANTLEQLGLAAPKKEQKYKGIKAVRKSLEMITKPATVLGETLDRIPRQTEFKLSEQRYAKIQNNITKELEQAQKQMAQAPDDKARETLQMHVLTLQHRLDNLEGDKQREATFRARDVMDYSRHGAGGASKAIKKYVNFANTATQSKDKMMRSLVERPVSTAAKIAGIAAPVITIQAQMYDHLTDDDKEAYDTIPAYYKQTNTLLPLGDNRYVSLPKSQEVAVVTNMLEAHMGLMDGIDAASFALKETTPYQLGNVTQALVPNDDGTVSFVDNITLPSTFAEPLVDVVTNSKMSFNRKPVVYGDEASNYVSPTIDSIPAVEGKPAADQLEYLTRQYGGDYSKYALAGLDSLLEKNTDRLNNLNPLQDRYKRDDSKWFKKMNYDREKQKNK